jgi:hypothetical protein
MNFSLFYKLVGFFELVGSLELMLMLKSIDCTMA